MKFINLINEDQVQILLSVASFVSLRPLTRFTKGVSIFSSKIPRNMVFLTNESANKAEIDILSARDTTRPGP